MLSKLNKNYVAMCDNNPHPFPNEYPHQLEVQIALMEFIGKKSFVPEGYYKITSKGQEVLRESLKG